jgi:hypothetical protein
MKRTNFQWQWNDGPIWPDIDMTRTRAAVLLRAWRRQARQPANYKNVNHFTRIGSGIYRAASSHGESGTMIICR